MDDLTALVSWYDDGRVGGENGERCKAICCDGERDLGAGMAGEEYSWPWRPAPGCRRFMAGLCMFSSPRLPLPAGYFFEASVGWAGGRLHQLPLSEPTKQRRREELVGGRKEVSG